MPSTIFTDFVTPVTAAWLNDVNAATYTLIPALSTSVVPAGTLIDFAGSTAPAGYLLCPTIPTNISRVTYAALFAAIGTVWGAGDGSTTFGIPYFPVGYAAVSGVGAGTTGVGTNLSHTHAVTDPGHVHPYTMYNTLGGTTGAAQGSVVGASTASTSAAVTGISLVASGGAANLPAYMGVNKCVKI